jgi:hypothetical protein
VLDEASLVASPRSVIGDRSLGDARMADVTDDRP